MWLLRLEYHHCLNLHMAIDSVHVTCLHTYLRHLQFPPVCVALVQGLRAAKRLVGNLGWPKFHCS